MTTISVIIPVYNAEGFLRDAVESALEQLEVVEVILVEDGSQDSSLSICKVLAIQNEKVRLFRHPNGANRGAGASRNLGVQKAKAEFIAFLDADDLYLPDRFQAAMKILEHDRTADGVYDATGVLFEDEMSRSRWKTQGRDNLTTITERLSPERVFETLVTGRYGQFCTDGIVVRRELFDRSGFFDPRLKMCQDTHLWVRMAAVGRLLPGQIDEPVSLRRVHANNRVGGRISETRRQYQRMMWLDLLRWGRKKRLSQERMVLLAGVCVQQIEHKYKDSRTSTYRLRRLSTACLGLAELIQIWPSIIHTKSFWETARQFMPGKKIRRRLAH